MSIATEIERIQNAKASIKASIENKGVVVGDGTIDTYASKIDEIPSGADVEITDASYLFYQGIRTSQLEDILKLCKKPTSTFSMFENCTVIHSINLSGFDTSEVTTMGRMFYKCSVLDPLDVSGFNTEKVIDMSYMFGRCIALQNLDLKNFNTSNVTTMDSMFDGVSKITSLDLSSFDTLKVETMRYMFGGCSSLTSLNLSSFNTSNVKDWERMFNSCTSLNSLDLSNFDASSATKINLMLYSCPNLENLIFMNNLGKGYTNKRANYDNYTLTLNGVNSLTHDSLMDVINKLYDLNLTYDVANGGTLYTQKLILGTTNMAKLTADEIAIATNKGWVVS